MNIADKLTTIAQNEQKVYAAGKQAEHDSFWDSYQANGNRTAYNSAFSKTGWTDDNFRPKYDIRPTNASQMFSESLVADLVSDLKEHNVVLDFSKCKNLYMAFYWCTRLTTVPIVDTTATTDDTQTFYYLFGNDSKLESIEKIILKETGEQVFSGTFSSCGALKEVRFEGVIGQNLDMTMSPSLSKDSIISIVNALSETASGKKLSLSKSAVNKAFGIDVDNESTYPEGSEYYTLRHSKDNWTFSYV